MNTKLNNIVDRLDALLLSRAVKDEAIVIIKEALREIAATLPDTQDQGFAIGKSGIGGPDKIGG